MTKSVRQPRPIMAVNDATHRAYGNTVQFRNGCLGKHIGEISDLKDFGPRKNRTINALTTASSSVAFHIGHVFKPSLPRKVLRVYTSFVPFAAEMRGFVFRGWRWPMNDFAHNPAGDSDDSAGTNLAISALRPVERPCQALIPGKMHSNFVNKFLSIPNICRTLPTQRIAVGKVPSVMCPAHAPCFLHFRAAIYDACAVLAVPNRASPKRVPVTLKPHVMFLTPTTGKNKFPATLDGALNHLDHPQHGGSISPL